MASTFRAALALALSMAPACLAGPPALRVSENRRFLVTAEGKPFLYLGDTAWELFHRLDRDEAVRYLDDRARKGFTVIQAVALAELDGVTDPNAYGHLPLRDLDPSRPAVQDGDRNDYWDHVDFIVSEAKRHEQGGGHVPQLVARLQADRLLLPRGRRARALHHRCGRVRPARWRGPPSHAVRRHERVHARRVVAGWALDLVPQDGRAILERPRAHAEGVRGEAGRQPAPSG